MTPNCSTCGWYAGGIDSPRGICRLPRMVHEYSLVDRCGHCEKYQPTEPTPPERTPYDNRTIHDAKSNMGRVGNDNAEKNTIPGLPPK
jgi:hypothetical protein